MNRQQEELRYESYLAYKRQNVADDLGNFVTRLAVAPFGMGVIEPSDARNDINREAMNDLPPLETVYQHKLADLSIRQMVELPVSRQALESLRRTDLALAA